MGEASKNHVTVRHVTFQKESSISDIRGRGLLSFSYTRKKCKFLTAAISTTCSVEQLLYLFLLFRTLCHAL